jgi:MFS family permease
MWTLVMGLNGLAATTFALLFVFRLGVGVVEANGPAAVSLLSDYYPVAERAKRMGLYLSGALIGAIVGLVGGGIAVTYGGWKWAFLMWVPVGVVVAVVVARQPEPRRGDQDADFHGDLTLTAGAGEIAEFAAVASLLPPPRREGTLDYSCCTVREVGRELLRIPTMWFGVIAVTISQLLLNGLQFWAVPYYKRVHHLSATKAGAITAAFGLGAAVGIIAGGFFADRLLRAGKVNARVYVVAFGSIGASLLLFPGFASTNLALSGSLMVIGGFLLTVPIAPAEALMTDVVVAQLRGRASSVRSVVRSLSSVGPFAIGGLSALLMSSGLSHADSLRFALVAFTPLYAVGGLVMLLAARTYGSDVAFVVAESRRHPDTATPSMPAPVA